MAPPPVPVRAQCDLTLRMSCYVHGGVICPRNRNLHDSVMQAAFEILSRELYGPLCPFERANDLTLSICCFAHGVLKVRGHGLFWGGPHPDLADALRKQVCPCFSLSLQCHMCNVAWSG